MAFGWRQGATVVQAPIRRRRPRIGSPRDFGLPCSTNGARWSFGKRRFLTDVTRRRNFSRASAVPQVGGATVYLDRLRASRSAGAHRTRALSYDPQEAHPDALMPDPLDQLKAALAQRYRVDREVGRGGMAHVFLAHDLKPLSDGVAGSSVRALCTHREVARRNAAGPGRARPQRPGWTGPPFSSMFSAPLTFMGLARAH
jgi:hypothetical protein